MHQSQQKLKGMKRLKAASVNSQQGLRLALLEPAFRQELILAVPLTLLALYWGAGFAEKAILIGVVWLVLIVEVLNTAIEAAIDRVGLETHELSKAAKDLGSAAVLISLVLAGVVWGLKLWLTLIG